MKTLLVLKKNKGAVLSVNLPTDQIPESLLEKFDIVEDVEEYEAGRFLMINEDGDLISGSLAGAKALSDALVEEGLLEEALEEVDGSMFGDDGRVFSTRSYVQKSGSTSSNGLEKKDEVQEEYDALGLGELEAASITFSDKTKQVHLSIKGKLPGFSVNGSTEYVLGVLQDPRVNSALNSVASHYASLEEAMGAANEALTEVRESSK
jgi:hypothetical protein